jgi:hypothetical protein
MYGQNWNGIDGIGMELMELEWAEEKWTMTLLPGGYVNGRMGEEREKNCGW